MWGDNQPKIISWDIFGYYLYLPATFIYHDLSYLSFIPQIAQKYSIAGTEQFALPDGKRIIQYTFGMSLLYSPFFFLGHIASKAFHYSTDGFSIPYQMSIAFGNLVYAFAGLVVMRKVLLKFFNDKIVALVLIILVLGTNYLYYTAIDGAFPHNYIFTLYACILFFTIRWHESHRLKDACFLAIALGLVVLIRPIEMVAIFIPLLWGVKTRDDFKERIHLLWKYKNHILILATIMLLIGLPQFLYWKKITGHFFFDSYDKRYNWFEFTNPKIWKVLFSFKKGWLIYTPVMAFAIIGLGVIYKKKKEIFYALVLYLIFNLYFVSSWNNWWYAASFSSRALVQSYSVLCIPLGFFFVYSFKNKIVKSISIVLTIFFVALNLFQTWQIRKGILHYEDMNQQYYWAIFGKTNPTRTDYNLLDVQEVIRDESKYEKTSIAKMDFENIADTSVLKNINNEVAHSGKYSFRSNWNARYSYPLIIPLNEIKAKPGSWIRATVWIFQPWGVWGSKLVMSFEKDNTAFKWEGIRMQSNVFQPNVWNRIYFETRIPESMPTESMLKVYVLNEGGMEILTDDFEVEILETK